MDQKKWIEILYRSDSLRPIRDPLVEKQARAVVRTYLCNAANNYEYPIGLVSDQKYLFREPIA